MKHGTMKVAVSCLLAGCMMFNAAGVSKASDAQSKAQGIAKLLGDEPVLGNIIEKLPDAAEIAVETQEWYKKALANTEDETFIYREADETSEAAGKMYSNTVVNVEGTIIIEEAGEIWSKISSGEVVGYIKNEHLVFGMDAVERAKEVCPERLADDGVTLVRDTQDAKSMEQLAKEEAAKKAAEEAARKEAERKAAEEAARKEAERKAEEERKAREAAKREAEKKASGEPKQAAVSASADDRTLLASIIYCEAGGEPYEGKVAVGAVVMNRVRSGRFPNSIREVIYQKGQFGPVSSGKLSRVLSKGSATEECYKAADAALAGENPIGSALFFGNGNTGQKIGGHYFH